MALEGKTDLDKFASLCKRTHEEQAVWFLNAFWEKVKDNAEKFWNYKHKFDEYDIAKKAAGSELDELNAHRFLEFYNNTHTVRELRDKAREIGWERRPMMFPISVYLLLEFKCDWHALVNAAQGNNSEELAEAKRLLDDAEAKTEIARQMEAQCVLAEKPFRQAEEEVKAALAEVKSQEDARERKTKDLTAASQGTGVKAGKAKQELAQHLAEDPLPLRKAKITLEAANRKAEKARAPFKAATEAATAALDEALNALKAAQDYLEEVKKKGGPEQGRIWWMERTVTERRKYLPTRRQ